MSSALQAVVVIYQLNDVAVVAQVQGVGFNVALQVIGFAGHGRQQGALGFLYLR